MGGQAAWLDREGAPGEALRMRVSTSSIVSVVLALALVASFAARPSVAQEPSASSVAATSTLVFVMAPCSIELDTSALPEGTVGKDAIERFGAVHVVPVGRAKVPGGWLLAVQQQITFVPDPAHTWDGSSLAR